MAEEAGGRVFFSGTNRSLEVEDEIRLSSVGVDIGSSTSHLVFSRLTLERLDNRYVVAEREVLHESGVLLTPYTADTSIDAPALGRFVEEQYRLAEIDPRTIDTGALILTGVAVRRANARAIGELFAAQAGKFVSVSAGDALEATLAAYGSGAVARSIREAQRVMNVDVGGGTSKIAVCEAGEIVELTALDVGARIVSFDARGRVSRIEEAGRRFSEEAGVSLEVGRLADPEGLGRMIGCMADRLFEAMSRSSLDARTIALLRLSPLRNERAPDLVTFSGGVSEYLYEREARQFGDLGAPLARAILARMEGWGTRIGRSDEGLRATVIGASQYTVQVSGGTIFVEPPGALPLRNIPVIAPELPLADPAVDAERVALAVRAALERLELASSEHPVALCYRWKESASFARLDGFCRGIVSGFEAALSRGLPLVLVGDGDIGGLIGLHCVEQLRLLNPVVSVDGIVLKEFDFVDIGEMIPASGAVPVVIKSLVFPGS
jgi:ethanolamine utilization protein EutA